MHLLVVEDEDAIAEPLVEGLARKVSRSTRVATGQAALEAPPADLVLLDLRLPDIDGFAVCRELRARSDVPIIMVTAKGEEIDRVVGLELGADDYVVKPFGLRELVARIRAVTRRTSARPERARRCRRRARGRRAGAPGDARRPRAAADGEGVRPARAARLGAGRRRRPPRILREVWDTTWYGSSKTVDVHVASLRKKLGDPTLIETVRGVGLRLRA